MLNRIKMAPWISYQVYFAEKETRAYISDAKNHKEILLEDVSAELFYYLASKFPLKKLKLFLLENDIENEINSFILELIEQDIFITEHKEKEVAFSNIDFNEEKNKENLKFFDEMQDFIQKNKFLSCVIIELTNKCNLDCIHCYNEYNDKFLHKIDDYKKIIDDAKRLGVMTIALSGGECTLHPDFLNIAKYIREKNIKLDIFTNGQSFYENPDLLDSFLKLYPNKISFSVYSTNPDIHDKITQVKGSYFKTLSIIKKLREKNINVEIKCFLTKYNIDQIEDLVKLAIEMKIAITIDPVLLYNKNKKNDDVQATEEQLQVFYTNRSKYLNYVVDEKPKKNPAIFNEMPLCNGGISQLAVSPNLILNPCVSFNYVLGNLKKNSLYDIFKDNSSSSPINNIRKLRRLNLLECGKEEYCEYCSYCLSKANSENGFLKKSDICCTHAKIKMKIAKTK